MKVLILSPYGDLIEDTVTASGYQAITRPETLEISDWPEADWVVSFGYRKIIPHGTIEKFKDRIINIHCSLLPWNKGAHPNFWSWFDDTPKGVTIHRVADAIDGGEVLARIIVGDMDFRPIGTLRSTYDDLLVAAAGLFKREWVKILSGDTHLTKLVVTHKGSYHRAGDIDKFYKLLPKQWDTQVKDIVCLGELYRGILYG